MLAAQAEHERQLEALRQATRQLEAEVSEEREAAGTARRALREMEREVQKLGDAVRADEGGCHAEGGRGGARGQPPRSPKEEIAICELKEEIGWLKAAVQMATSNIDLARGAQRATAGEHSAQVKSLQDEVRAEMQRVQQRLAAVEGHAACGFATVRELEVRDAEIGEVRRALADVRLGQAECKLAASTQPQIVAAVQALVVDAELRASLDEKVRR